MFTPPHHCAASGLKAKQVPNPTSQCQRLKSKPTDRAQEGVFGHKGWRFLRYSFVPHLNIVDSNHTMLGFSPAFIRRPHNPAAQG